MKIGNWLKNKKQSSRKNKIKISQSWGKAAADRSKVKQVAKVVVVKIKKEESQKTCSCQSCQNCPKGNKSMNIAVKQKCLNYLQINEKGGNYRGGAFGFYLVEIKAPKKALESTWKRKKNVKLERCTWKRISKYSCI